MIVRGALENLLFFHPHPMSKVCIKSLFFLISLELKLSLNLQKVRTIGFSIFLGRKDLNYLETKLDLLLKERWKDWIKFLKGDVIKKLNGKI